LSKAGFCICLFLFTVLKQATMRLSEFIVLTQEEKRLTVVNEGVPLAKKELSEEMIFLFRLPGFFVETHFSKQTKEIREYLMFRDSPELTPAWKLIQ
jgi:hypothetical protein